MNLFKAINVKANYFHLDPRSALAYRMGFSLWLIFDLLCRWPYAWELYAGGWIDTEIFRASAAPYNFSLLWATRHPYFPHLFFVGLLVVYVAMLVGYQLKWMRPLALLGFMSVMNANLIARDGGDCITMLMLLWNLFLPLTKHEAATTANRFGILGARLQVSWIYFSAGVTKTGMSWVSGDAFYYLSHFQQMGTTLGGYLNRLPLQFLRHFTWSVHWLEVVAPVLLLLPTSSPWFRRAGVALLLSLQLGIALTVHTGFQTLMASTLLLFLHDSDWRALAWLTGKVGRQLPATWRETPTPELPFWRRLRVSEVFAAYFLYVCVAMAGSHYGTTWLTPVAQRIFTSLPTTETWNLFAPDVPLVDAWWNFYGVTPTGEEWDLQTGERFKREKPEDVYWIYGRSRFKLMENYSYNQAMEGQRFRLLHYWLSEFRKVHPSLPLKEARFSLMTEPTPRPDEWQAGLRPKRIETTLWVYLIPEAHSGKPKSISHKAKPARSSIH